MDNSTDEERSILLRRPRVLFPPGDDDTAAAAGALNITPVSEINDAASTKKKDQELSSEAQLRRLVEQYNNRKPIKMIGYQSGQRQNNLSLLEEEQQEVNEYKNKAPSLSPKSVFAVFPGVVVVALLDRLISLLRIQPRWQESPILDKSLEASLKDVRASTGYEAYAAAAALLQKISLDILARDEDDDSADEKYFLQSQQEAETDAQRVTFWINVHNLAVLHACIERGPPLTRATHSAVVRYYAWSRAQKLALGSQAFSIFQMEHSILRGGGFTSNKWVSETKSISPNSKSGSRINDDLPPQPPRWSSWLSDFPLARFAKNDDRRLLVPRFPPTPELSFALFTATESSAPLTVFRAETKDELASELRTHAATFLANSVTVAPLLTESPLRFSRSSSAYVDDQKKKVLLTTRTSSSVTATSDDYDCDQGDFPLSPPGSPTSQNSNGVLVVLPAAMRYHAYNWGRTSADVIAAVHAILEDELGDDRLASTVRMLNTLDAAETSMKTTRCSAFRSSNGAFYSPSSSLRKSFSRNGTSPTLFKLKVKYQSYEWSPAIKLATSYS